MNSEEAKNVAQIERIVVNGKTKIKYDGKRKLWIEGKKTH